MEPERLASSERQRARADSIRQLISQKRDVSYVQLALDLRRGQIQRLEAFAVRRAATLQKAEDELEADAAQFDDFLRLNDEEVQAAVRQADDQASIRQDKAVKIKQLSAHLASIKSDINRQEDLLEECACYKAFLARLTPKAWLEEVDHTRQQAKEARHRAWVAAVDAVRQTHADADAAAASAEHDMATARSQQEYNRAKARLTQAQAEQQQAACLQEPPEPQDPPEELLEPTYFTDPKLLSLELHNLEAANAAATQRLQAAAGELEEFRVQAKAMHADTDESVFALQAELDRLQPAWRGSKRMSTVSIGSQRRRGSVQSTHSRDGGGRAHGGKLSVIHDDG